MRQKPLAILCVSILVLTWLPLEASAAVPNGSHKIVVDSKDTNTLVQLARGGATLLADYGSFSVWRTNDTQRQSVAARSSVKTRDDFDQINLRGGKTIATTSGPTGGAPAVASSLQQAKTSGFQLWMVQFVGPIKPAWLDRLRKLGIEIVQYMPNNAYVVWLDGARLAQLENLAKNDPTVQWEGPYHPAYRLAPSLQTAKAQTAALVPVTVQFYRTTNTPASVASLKALGGKVFKQPSNILKYTNISLEVPGNQLAAIAARADVFNVEPYVAPRKRDEVQGQILAGNVTTTNPIVPTGPGYLTFLNTLGFPQTPDQYPVVDIVDDGIDNGTTSPLHPDFYPLGVRPGDGSGSRVVFNNSCIASGLSDGADGHGNINAGIVGAFNNTGSAPYIDANGYNIGLGISPYGRVAGTKIFDDNRGPFDEANCGGTDADTVAFAYGAGANITSNSWGSPGTDGAYNAEAQAYDVLTRDATNSDTNTHQMLHVFAAGNDGSGPQTIESPGTAKNVLTVGATENVRDNGVADGCGIIAAATADNIADFSSRGPTTDLRAKPDIVAPGTHIQGPASQDPNYEGMGVCGNGTGDERYYPTTTPTQQTLYTWSSGTSHSTPAIAGVASLVYNFYGRVLKPGQAPSPAMTKALILNAPRALNCAACNLPDPNQGWGDANLKAIFDPALAGHRYVVDQTTIFTTTGETFVKMGTIPNTSKPFHVTLAWTDAPGSTTGNALVNNLDLEVTVGGQVYKGNVFSGANSAPNGTSDTINNVENVFLPGGVSGPFTVKVTAANLAGAAVPGTASLTNQDFALVIYNGDVTASPALSLASIATSDAAPGGNGNNAVEPGETIKLTVALKDSGEATATGVSGTITTTNSAVTLSNPTSAYPDIGANATAANTASFVFTLGAQQACGTTLDFTETVTYNGGNTTTVSFTIPIGVPGPITTYTSTDVPKAIPDNDPTGATSTIAINASGVATKIRVRVSITHTYDQDLTLSLIAPSGQTITVSAQNGGSGDNYTNTVFDDAALFSIADLSVAGPPYTGSFRPEQPLSTLDGASISGTWKLFVMDGAPADTGTIEAFALDLQTVPSVCVAYPPPTVTGISPASGPTSGGTPVTIQGTNFGGQTAVTFDGVPATNVVVANSTTITAVTPAHPASGAVNVQVTTNGVTLPLTNGYTYGTIIPKPVYPAPGGAGSPSPAPSGRSGGVPGPAGNETPAPLPPKR